MTRLIRTELLKLSTVRVTWGLLAGAAALSALFASLEAYRAGNGSSGVAAITTASGLLTVTTVTGFGMLLAAVLGLISATGEFRHGSATLSYLATPQRGRVLAAKAVAAACFGAGFGLVAAVMAVGVGLGFAAGHDGPLALGAGALAGHAAGAMLGGALLGALGVAVGSLVRSQLAAVIGIFVWAVVLESLIGGLFTAVRPYLPYTAATTLAGAPLGAAAFGPARTVSGGGGPLPFVAAAALIAAVAGAVALVAARTTVARDVT
jgi:ABC-type transport system involved in multi-copper enzyme maturation permease subunit